MQIVRANRPAPKPIQPAPQHMSNVITFNNDIKITSRCLKDIFSSATFPGAPDDPEYQPTCVFLLLFDPGRPRILAIQKSDRYGYPWRNQIALPGGHRDQDDPSAMDTAFRELDEELGIPRNQVDLIGSMGHFQTIHHKDIEVFVGMWDGRGPVRYDAEEISRVLVIPLKKLIRLHMSSVSSGNPSGSEAITYPFKDVVIWGVTAKILYHFIELIYPKVTSTGPAPDILSGSSPLAP